MKTTLSLPSSLTALAPVGETSKRETMACEVGRVAEQETADVADLMLFLCDDDRCDKEQGGSLATSRRLPGKRADWWSKFMQPMGDVAAVRSYEGVLVRLVAMKPPDGAVLPRLVYDALRMGMLDFSKALVGTWRGPATSEKGKSVWTQAVWLSRGKYVPVWCLLWRPYFNRVCQLPASTIAERGAVFARLRGEYWGLLPKWVQESCTVLGDGYADVEGVLVAWRRGQLEDLVALYARSQAVLAARVATHPQWQYDKKRQADGGAGACASDGPRKRPCANPGLNSTSLVIGTGV